MCYISVSRLSIKKLTASLPKLSYCLQSGRLCYVYTHELQYIYIHERQCIYTHVHVLQLF